MREQFIAPAGHAPVPLESDPLFARAVAQAGIGAWACELADNALSWTPGVYRLFGFEPGRRVDRREAVALYDEDSRATMERLRAEAIAHARPFAMEAQIVTIDGARRWMRLTADVVRENGRITRLFGIKQDITAEKAQWEALRRQAERDPLTGLANRAVFEGSFMNGAGAVPAGALVLVDLDNFKHINDRFGHAAGDACLRAAGERIAAAFAGAAVMARIGGDEFAIVTAPGASAAAVERQVVRLLLQLSRPIGWCGQRLVLGASAGIAPVADPARYDAEALFAAADAALYGAKAAGRGVVLTAGATVIAPPRLAARG